MFTDCMNPCQCTNLALCHTIESLPDKVPLVCLGHNEIFFPSLSYPHDAYCILLHCGHGKQRADFSSDMHQRDWACVGAPPRGFLVDFLPFVAGQHVSWAPTSGLSASPSVWGANHVPFRSRTLVRVVPSASKQQRFFAGHDVRRAPAIFDLATIACSQ